MPDRLPDTTHRSRHAARWLLAIGIALAASLAAQAQAQAQPLPGVSSARQAAQLLEHAEAPRRAAAVLWFGENGRESDAVRVAPRLHDEHPQVREIAEQSMWLMWSRSGDPGVDQVLARGTEQMARGELAAAIASFDEVIRRRPAFAEGWNKRATAHFLAGDLRRSLADCDEVVKRNPLHFGVLSGYGQIYFRLEEFELALDYFRRALAINPNMDGVRTNIRALEELIAQKRRRTT